MEIVENKFGENFSEFVLKGEDHTLANMLCQELRRLKGVIFAGYRIPHPLSKEVLLQLRTDGSVTPKDALIIAAKSLSASLKGFLNEL
ncbi:DNA-directed RNA polymerase subunit L [Candidatus Marsarchaeota G2 archaeon ECH_B_SAG-F08]|jgi:DNA-directed RNA polymerase subunit L|uniref:DNA-directed RNA polymerase subunit Rpo11 n=3 Tax=Candidatus Marsarchaeota TaxID=1978152 RepID=A0A2R6AKJ7_9ARCH|nr:MAG: DNA-directed RNA polymerase subunit L [Candidatus Marsarchaeota G1 archaeon BE_D]PSN89569.1 MAG: DNA-directed RNA polymerase subunit L [Candidatus Marsarchaeota G1 archaeon OSP_C]PSN98930.1 MAG: DNA-directed RNA polymerase subunit L [Candidatus Marsarchaeota G2 archaeon ECH_B_SAG-F08]